MAHTQPNQSCIITAGIYFPPSKSANEVKEFTEYITKCLDSILKERPNLPKIQSTKGSSPPPPTRGSNTLDQLLTNMSKLYNKVQHLPPLGRSDHQCVLFTPLGTVHFLPGRVGWWKWLCLYKTLDGPPPSTQLFPVAHPQRMICFKVTHPHK